MMLQPTDIYRLPARFMHWLVVVLMIFTVALGFIADDLEFSPLKITLFNWHKWLGLTIWMVTVMRLLWRWISPPPALPATYARWIHTMSSLAHWGLYALMLLVPIIGWLASSAFGVPVVWYGWLTIPDLIGPSQPMADFFAETHEIFAKTLLVLIGLHLAAALFHHWILRDGLLGRMWRNRKLPSNQLAIIAVAGSLFIAGQADAKSWQISPGDSRLGFTAYQGNAPMQGAFTTFGGLIEFDPLNPEQAKVDITIDMTSLATDNSKIRTELPKKVWFDLANFPQANYQAEGFTALEDGSWQIDGILTLKGARAVIPLTAEIVIGSDGSSARVRAQGQVPRLDFAVGTGAWADEGTVKKNVMIDIELTAHHRSQ
ncbi:MAG: cytochrome b/b6 domain-containing protein [Pseudomonadota bacterium]